MVETKAELGVGMRALREAVNSLAATAAGHYFTYLLLGAYLGLTIAATTDEQLLRVSPVTLPILDVELPTVAFYAVVPWLLVLVHIYLLLQLYHLAKRVHLLDDTLEGLDGKAARAEERTLLSPFPVVQMLAGERSTFMGVINAAVVWVTVVWLPLLLVLSAQVRFLPYHHSLVTTGGRLAVIVELAVLWTFWPPILNGDAAAVKRWFARGARSLVGWLQRAARRAAPVAAPVVPVGKGTGLGLLTATSALVLAFSWLVAVLPGEPMERWVAYLLPAPAGGRMDGSGAPGNALTYWVFDGPNAPLHRNLDLAERRLVATDVEPRERRVLRAYRTNERMEIIPKVVGLDLSGRDLRQANFYRAVLINADLRGANLDGADLRYADLAGVDMRPMEVAPGATCVDDSQKRNAPARDVAGVAFVSESATYCATSARESSFRNAQLLDARAQLALLERADFRSADLAYGRFDGADLRGADLRRPRFAFATFLGADLRGSNLSGGGDGYPRLNTDSVDLTGASIRHFDLARLMITSAAFARFDDVVLTLARLGGGDLRGAVFQRADLRSANLDRADLRGARFEEADLRGATLREARADLARLERTGVCMADLTGASLQGADLDRSTFDGSSLAGVDLSYAGISQVNARAANLRGAALRPFETFALVLNYADVRQLEDRSGGDAAALEETAGELREADWRPSEWQNQMLSALAGGQMVTATPHEVGVVARQPLLCDETTEQLPGDLAPHCVDAAQRLTFLRSALPAACDDPNVMSGLIKQSGLPVGAMSNRRGPSLGPGAERDYFAALVSGAERCPNTVEGIDTPARELLAQMRITIQNAPPFRGPLPVETVEAPCERG